MKHVVLILMFVGLLPWGAFGEVVVLTETPVAEFTLPDGTVLTNAYAWRKSSQGIMIMHDGGNYFLNFAILPDDWKASYLGAPKVDNNSPNSPVVEPDAGVSEPLRDRYEIRSVLESIPELDPASRLLLLNAASSGELDQQILMLGVLQSLLTGKDSVAKRLHIMIEEKEYELDDVDAEELFRSCNECMGDGRLTKSCATCDGSGECKRCAGVGTRKSSFDDSRMHCTTCRGSGSCPACRGDGGLSAKCLKCKGRGKTLNRPYCEALRNHLVRQVNAVAVPDKPSAVTASNADQIGKALRRIPEMKPDAVKFYFSDEYKGGMDTNLVVACLIHSLLREDFEQAERFLLMLEVVYADEEVVEVEKYLTPCKTCDSTGGIDRTCRRCKGSGDCHRCGGTGERTQEIDTSSKMHCTTCRGTGECAACRGKGIFRTKCATCEGHGKALERQRCKIKLELLVERLNAYYAEQ